MIVPYKGGKQDEALIAEITTRIQDKLTEWYGSEAELVSTLPEIRSYTNSFILRYEVKAPHAPGVLVKIRRIPSMASLVQAIHEPELHANIPEEYGTLKFVYERIGDTHKDFTAIRSLAYFENMFAIVMEEFKSQSLHDLLEAAQKKSDHSMLREAARKSGTLLRFFHDRVHATEEMPYTVDDILAEVKLRAELLECYSRKAVSAQSIMELFTRKLADSDVRSIPVSETHQDLTCANILYSPEGNACLIDIKTKPAPIYFDLGLLLIHPDTFRKQIYSNGRHLSKSLLTEYRGEILRGYFAEQSVPASLVNIFCGLRILDKWVMNAELFHRYKRLKRILTRPLVPFVNFYFRKLLIRYLNMA